MTTLLGAAIALGVGGLVVEATSARTTFVIAGVGVLCVTVVDGVLLEWLVVVGLRIRADEEV